MKKIIAFPFICLLVIPLFIAVILLSIIVFIRHGYEDFREFIGEIFDDFKFISEIYNDFE